MVKFEREAPGIYIMIRRLQYRCSFKSGINETDLSKAVDTCRERFTDLVKEGRICNASFYKHENMGFLYIEEIVGSDSDPVISVETIMSDLISCLKSWPREEGDVFFVPMINVYYHHIPDGDLDVWERERTTAKKTRIGRIAFVYPEKLPSYVKYHTDIVNEGLLKGDKYQFISLHENILFSYYEEPRNNVNLRETDEESKVIEEWLKVDPESHFDRDKACGNNFLVIPCLFTIDRLDL